MLRGFVLLGTLLLLAGCGGAPVTAPTVVATVGPANTPTAAPVNTIPVVATATAAAPAATATAVPLVPTATVAPPTATVPPPTATSPPAAADVQVLNFSSYTDSLGGLNVIGQVQNKGQALASDIQVTADATDANGDTVASGSDYLLALVYLPPGATAPFQVSLGKPTGKPAKENVNGQFKTYDPSGFIIFPPADGLKVEGMKFAPASGYNSAKVTGRVHNTGKQTASGVSVLVTGYDAKGKLAAVAKGSPDLDTIPPDGTAAFTVTFFGDQVAPVTKVATFASGYVEK